MNWQLVETDDHLREIMASAEHCEAVVLDTEFMRRNTFYPEVALLQVCFDDGGADTPQAWLIDPLKIEDTTEIRALLGNPAIVKVLHSGSEDLEVFQRWLGMLPAPLFDTQKAAALLDMGFGLGYRALVMELLGVDLPKGETRSDWLQRPLTDSQCNYAAQDVTCLLPVWHILKERAIASDKLNWILADGNDTIAAANSPAAPSYQRVKGAWKLEADQLAALAAICQWREETARQKNKPRGWILDDRACLQLAQALPTSEPGLHEVEELPAVVIRKHGRVLLDILHQQAAQSAEDGPPPLPKPLGPDQRKTLKALKARSREIAAQLGIAPESAMQSKDYELLVREAGGEAIEVPPHWTGWRREHVVQPLRTSLARGNQ